MCSFRVVNVLWSREDSTKLSLSYHFSQPTRSISVRFHESDGGFFKNNLELTPWSML